LRVSLRALWTQKSGNDLHEFEDAFEPVSSQIIDSETLNVAIADGATESSFSSLWAKLLVSETVLCNPYSIEDLRRTTMRCIRIWKRITGHRPLPWYAEEKVKQGAHSTLLGVYFSRDETSRLRAIAVGDSCFFQVRAEGLLTAFPIDRSDKFGSTPLLLSTNIAYNERIWPNVCMYDGEWRDGDALLIMTDALAQWFLTQSQNGNQPWTDVLGFEEREDFSNWIQMLRQSGSIRNDDVTLLILTAV